jgi:hypothetical protein
MKKRNFVVLGGGTAGWITALFLNRMLPNDKVTLIQNSKIGIIGVGEATTPPIITFLNNIGIDYRDVLKETKGGIKNAINFENWNGDGKKYFHSFQDKVLNFQIPNVFGQDCVDYYLKNLIRKNLPMNEYYYCTKLSAGKKIDLDRTHFALHFDTNLFSLFLQKTGKERGVEIVDGDFNHVTQNENGFIKKIHLKDEREFDADFVFDCTGFSRLLIGKVFDEKWICYKNHLPMKKAIPFWLEPDSDGKIEPYTSAIAMKYGWMWKIPLQHRSGSGYIFDSDYIDENQALEEAENHFGKKLEVRRIIPFEAGRYQNFWVKNCMAIGLASSFIEPLESTSIFLSVQQLETFRHFINEIDEPNDYSVSLFNEIVGNNMEDTLSFVYLHYLTKRNDSEFWKNFRENYPPPKKLTGMLEIIKENNLRYFNTQDTRTTGNFPMGSFLQVCLGNEFFEKEINIKGYENVQPSPFEYKKIIDELYKNAPDHKEFLLSL